MTDTDTPDDMTTEEAAAAIRAWADAQGLTMAATFVPYSQAKASRADWQGGPGGKPWVGITWTMQFSKGGRVVFETPYSAGIAHCPGYKASKAALAGAPHREAKARELLCAWECEHGRPGRYSTVMGDENGIAAAFKPANLPGPDLVDVLASLARDADVLDAGGFENWASDLGYDTDSPKAEAAYKACIEIALKMRAAVGDPALSELSRLAGFW